MVFNKKANVDSKFDCVADIVHGKENVRIKVRVIRCGRLLVSSILESSSLEMVLIGEKGGKVHVFVQKRLIYMFQSKLEEGQVYEMSNFTIFPQLTHKESFSEP
ncbi:replication factor A protein [Trifolium repens]|nr:replication factor A protein [Trifolium repens]